MQNMVDVGRREGSLRTEGIFRYFLCFIYLFFVYLPTSTGRTRRPITTVCGSKRVFPRKVEPFGGLDDKKIMFAGQNFPKTWFLGTWIGISSQICEIFESRYLEK